MNHQIELDPSRRSKTLHLKLQNLYQSQLAHYKYEVINFFSGLKASQLIQSRMNNERERPIQRNNIHNIKTNGTLIKYVPPPR